MYKERAHLVLSGLAMLVFGAAYSILLATRATWVLHNGFAIFILYYAVQRFVATVEL